MYIWGKDRAAGRVGSDFLSTYAGRVGSGRVDVSPGRIKKSGPLTTLEEARRTSSRRVVK